MVAQQTGAQVIKLPLNDRRLPDVERLPELITSRSRILALGQMSNVTGGCPDLASAISAAHAAGMVVMVDGAQGAVHFRRMFSSLISIFMLFPLTNCMARPVSACCTVSRSFLRRCRPARRRQDDP